MQRKHDEALELALDTVKQDPLGVRPRIAASLCLLDRGDWHQAHSIYKELRESDVNDPRVKALSVILGHEADAQDIEDSLVLKKQIIAPLVGRCPSQSCCRFGNQRWYR